jgi:hypothetical protein
MELCSSQESKSQERGRRCRQRSVWLFETAQQRRQNTIPPVVVEIIIDTSKENEIEKTLV